MRTGLASGVAAYLAWGFIPVYFKQVALVPAGEVLGHRIVWSVVFVSIVLAWRRQWGELIGCVRSRRTLLWLTASTSMLAVNWFVFIWAVANDRVLQASLGYYINPLVNVLLGFVFLRERLRPWQLAGFALAAVAVGILTVEQGKLPWVSLTLAGTFGLYGLLRKTAQIGPLVGTAAETMILLPLGLWLGLGGLWREETVSGYGWLPLAGLVTTVPLLWFAAAAKRLRLMTLGILQYIAPTCNFLLAVCVYDEPFTAVHLASFGLIWTALGVYTADSIRTYWATGRQPEGQEQTLVKE